MQGQPPIDYRALMQILQSGMVQPAAGDRHSLDWLLQSIQQGVPPSQVVRK
jgi:hypothetical protein